MITVCANDYVIFTSHNQEVYVTETSHFLRIKEERKRLKLTQAEAGALAGVTRESWSRYESGALAPGLEVMKAFAIAGADVHYILTGRYSEIATEDERYFLARFRASSPGLRDAAVRVLLGDSIAEQSRHSFQEVGQYIHGSVNQSGLTLHVGGSKRKK